MWLEYCELEKGCILGNQEIRDSLSPSKELEFYPKYSGKLLEGFKQESHMTWVVFKKIVLVPLWWVEKIGTPDCKKKVHWGERLVFWTIVVGIEIQRSGLICGIFWMWADGICWSTRYTRYWKKPKQGQLTGFWPKQLNHEAVHWGLNPDLLNTPAVSFERGVSNCLFQWGILPFEVLSYYSIYRKQGRREWYCRLHLNSGLPAPNVCCKRFE